MAYKGKNPNYEHYYGLMIKMGFDDEDANLLASLKEIEDMDEAKARYRARTNIIERARDRVEYEIRNLINKIGK